jgi:hypothetical protein
MDSSKGSAGQPSGVANETEVGMKRDNVLFKNLVMKGTSLINTYNKSRTHYNLSSSLDSEGAVTITNLSVGHEAEERYAFK